MDCIGPPISGRQAIFTVEAGRCGGVHSRTGVRACSAMGITTAKVFGAAAHRRSTAARLLSVSEVLGGTHEYTTRTQRTQQARRHSDPNLQMETPRAGSASADADARPEGGGPLR